MSTEKTKELIHTYYDAFNKRDMEKFFSLMTEDVAHDVNQRDRQMGKAEFKKFMEVSFDHCKERCFDIVIMTNEKGDHAAAEFMCEGTYLKTAQGFPEARKQQYKLPVGAFFEIKGGKISRVTTYYNMSEWIEKVKK
ncbi:MAG TPA: ketosteroid isomerase-related protein [Rhabdochlamydiaceae bacterium]|nr:ketosteroid isomerase-related protein [Rhabdochlamydiaceae bacterium]